MNIQMLAMFGNGNAQNVSFDVPDGCPICRHAIQAVPFERAIVDAAPGSPAHRLQAVFRCPRPPCFRLYILRFERAVEVPGYVTIEHAVYWTLVAIEPTVHVPRTFSPEIGRTSPGFDQIYNQAAAAEAAGLNQLCGVGYRKALEFLIKDYVKTLSENADRHGEIDRTPLGACISKFVREGRIQATASRATWLGNDETHYVRTWEDKDLSDLKKLIDLTLYWIGAEILTRELEASMPDPKKALPKGE
jgi:hypothetical protein